MNTTFGFLGQPGVPGPPQPGQAQQPVGGQSADPQGAYLAQALQSLQSSGAQSKTPGAVGENLMADALMQYGQHQHQAQQSALDAPGAQASSVVLPQGGDPLANLSAMAPTSQAAGGLLDMGGALGMSQAAGLAGLAGGSAGGSMNLQNLLAMFGAG